ncbi:MAG: GFA family protein [Cocleimonas sp.]|nr:GFA family protein [Cocleimonas sp.]
MYKGQCLCGAIKYEVDEIKPQMGHCHCSMCRKFHGAAFSTLGEADVKDFRWVEGEELLKDYVAGNGSVRQFCQNCGSSMTFSVSEKPNGLIEFSLGTLDSDLDVLPDAHVYTGSKANWMEVCDDLPQHKKDRI